MRQLLFQLEVAVMNCARVLITLRAGFHGLTCGHLLVIEPRPQVAGSNSQSQGRSRSAMRMILSIVVILLSLTSPVQAWWWPNGVIVCNALESQYKPCIVRDGSGGAIIAWADSRNYNWDIYAQRVDGAGNVVWAANGVPVCTAVGGQNFPRIASDGAGGAIIAWRDGRGRGGEHVYAQRLDASGFALWVTDGVPICTSTTMHPEMASDGAGGAVITWEHYTGSDWDIYAQRVDDAGIVQWSGGGKAVCSAAGLQKYPKIISDGTGGAIIVWKDNRSGAEGVYAQRVAADGYLEWTANGVCISDDSANDDHHELATDSGHGAIITWMGSGVHGSHIYAQRIDISGNLVWNGGNPVGVDTLDYSQSYPEIASDGTGGAIITWEDLYPGSPQNFRSISAQKLDEWGSALWAANGVPVYTEQGGHRYAPQIASDDVGGAVITWEDDRNGNLDVYVQRLNPSGVKMWPDTVHTSISRDSQAEPRIIPDGSSGAIITWQDNRKQGDIDIFTMRLCSTGLPCPTDASEPPPVYFLMQNFPNPFNPVTRIIYNIGEPAKVSLGIYDCKGGLVKILVDGYREAGSHTEAWRGRDKSGRPVDSGVYFYRLEAGSFNGTKKMVIIR